MHTRDLREARQFGKDLFNAWLDSNTPRLGAALAYYTVFAIAPLFLIALSLAGFWFGKDAARQQLFSQINGLLGREGGQVIQSVVTAANKPAAGTWATAAAVVALVAGATAVFVELQDALNTIWGVKQPAGQGIRHFIRARVLSFAMVLGIGFLLLVSLILNTILAAFGKYSGGFLPNHFIWETVNNLTSLGVITLLFAMILKVLPDVQIAWKDVWCGAFFTALLFNFGKFLIGYYLGRSSFMSVYGAAGSFVLLLMWVYYSAQILFLGAEFTRLYARRNGHPGPQDQSNDADRTRSK